jgi:hypothetical protein
MQVSPEQVEKIKKEKTDGWFEVDFPPIIDKMLWEKAQEKRVQSRGGFNRKRPKPILAGRIFCGVCQRSFHDAMYNKGTKLVFKCNGKLKQYHLDAARNATALCLTAKQLLQKSKNGLLICFKTKNRCGKPSRSTSVRWNASLLSAGVMSITGRRWKTLQSWSRTVGFPQRIVTWEELLDRLQVKPWVYPDRLEVRGIVPIEDIANPKCCLVILCLFPADPIIQ